MKTDEIYYSIQWEEKTLKKQISFVVTLALVLGLFSISAFAADTKIGTTSTGTITGSAIVTTAPAVTTTAPAVTATTPAVTTTAPAVTTTAPAATAPAVTAPEKASATPTVSKVLVDGTAVSFDAYNINGNNYFKLRDLASAVNSSKKQFEVSFDAAKNAIDLKSNSAYTKVGGEMTKSDGNAKDAVLSASKIYKDGTEQKLTAYNIDGNNYFKLRDLAQAFNIGVKFDSDTNTINIDTNSDYVAQ